MAVSLAAIFVLASQTQPASFPPPPAIVHGYVHFERGAATTPPAGLIAVGRVARTMPAGAYITVRGQTDTVGRPEDNLTLSRRRALFVAAYVVRLGANPDRIQIISCGETLQNRPTADDVDEPLNRFAMFDYWTSPHTTSLDCEVETYQQALERR